MSMSLQHDNSASTGGDESSPSPTPSPSSSTPRPRPNMMFTLTRSSPSEKNMIDEQLAQTTFESLITDQIAIIFGFLKHNEIMHARRVCTTWRDAAKKTLVPPSDFQVKNLRSYNAMRVMSTEIPNIQQLSICDLGARSKYSDGEDPDEEQAARTANYTAHDLNIISNFRMLRILNVVCSENLNGRYPALFDFSFLQKLELSVGCNLKWDLDMLSGCPLLRELRLMYLQQNSTGNLKSLRVLKDTLEEVNLTYCHNIRGNFMELADFPRLRDLYISCTPITGDIRHIQEDDFSAAERLVLPNTVIGGRFYDFHRISDVSSFMQAIHPLLKRFPESFNDASWRLSKDSPDWYDEDDGPMPPLEIQLVFAEELLCGWRWCCSDIDWDDEIVHNCEVNWLDPEPLAKSMVTQSTIFDSFYNVSMHSIDSKTDFYRGYYEPPTEEEYRRLCLR